MGRRKGRDVSGWIVIDKPAGVTSNDVVGKVRRAFGARKAGHAGTLDPAATGTLAVALGEATKTVPFVTDAMKGYRFCVRLGQATDTDDGEGSVIAQSDVRPDDAAIAAALPTFTGDIVQVPPQYSAVKVDGARAYALAREGTEMDLAARPLHVAHLAMVDRPDADHVTLEMTCGKGGYVRAVARDLGAALDCNGHVAWLRRTWSGPFAADDGVTLDTIAAEAGTAALDARLLPVAAGLADLPELRCTEAGAVRLRNGNPGEVTTGVEYGDLAWASHGGVPVAVGVYRAGTLHPQRVFNLG